ncbi:MULTISPECIES: alpha/beta fold hydrolase [unclassified Rhizobium]|uniref:alpha/beta fold hydrolase n=2 Tax=unclassified Rhizobium TaxID=2613769 RepID=UPI001AD9BECC|nr:MULTISPECIES: alpha/beta fold hydrolase [unclassified Rhizobium]MBZ5819835.1 alpha/beta fold hydrolase [Rhizobium sp. VS19-DR183]
MGVPVTFQGCAGFIHDGSGSTGVVMLPAWGFEELTIRRGWAGFAERLAKAGYCCLRFDWPGAGDSIGDTKAGISLADWLDAVKAAANVLTERYSLERVVLVGHGVGGLLAPHCADLVSAAAVVQMAPQSEGRTGLRELEILGRLIGSFLGLPNAPSKDTIEIAGHSISMALAKEIAALRLDESTHLRSAIPLLSVLRPGIPGAADWPKRLATAGFTVTAATYTGSEGFLAYNQASVSPLECFENVCAWLVQTVPPGTREVPGQRPLAEALRGDGYSERPVLFGHGGRLFAILCLPDTSPPRATVIMINSGDNYHIGWARMHVEFARKLARQGIASFRIDTGGIGDAEDIDGHAYYVDGQTRDVIEAVTTVEALGLGPVLVSGRCSGGYAAIQTAVADPRIRGLVAVNTVRLGLSPSETFEQIMSGGTSSVANYRRRAFSTQIARDVLSGRKSLLAVSAKGLRIARRQLSARLPPFAGALSSAGRLTASIRQQAQQLQDRGVAVFLLYAENDGGLDELARHFGKRHASEYDHATIRIAAGAEHNMTARYARDEILKELVACVEAIERLGKAALVLPPADMANKGLT